MSSFEDFRGWKPVSGCKLRRGQLALLNVISREIKRQYNGFLPTGYGKTYCSAIALGVMRAQRRVNRMLVVVPSDQQRTDFMDSLPKACKKLGLEISGCDVCGESRIFRRSLSGDAEVFVTTIQHVYADFEAQGKRNFNDGYYAELLREGEWLIVADEHHHYRENKAWGDALNSLKFTARLGLSATPLSSKGEPSVIGQDYDVIVTIQEAFEEEAIRRIVGHILEHQVELVIGDSDEVLQLTTSEIAEDIMPDESIQSWEVRRKVRYCSNYISETMAAAILTLNAKNLKHPKSQEEDLKPTDPQGSQHQMLVFAMSCRHAKHVSELLNATYGYDGEKFSDWIGTGPDGRQDGENRQIVKDYKANKFKCLVQVDKAGEGFDNPRSSVLVFINNGKSGSNKSRQHFGRGFRRNYGIKSFKEDVCDIFVSSDSDLAELVRDLDWKTRPSTQDPDDDDWGDPEDNPDDIFYDIPELIVLRTKLSYTELVEPLGGIPEEIQRLKDTDGLRDLGEEHLLDLVYKAMYRRKEEIEEQNEMLTLQNIRDQVKENTRMLATQVAKIRYGSQLPKGSVGAICTAINSKWKKENLSHEEMTMEEFRRKNSWIKQINATIIQSRDLSRFPWLLA